MVKNNGLPLGEVVLFGILGALTFALKFAMAALPNIEPVSLLMMVFGAVFGWKALYPCYVYVAMEILTFGIGTWNVNYLYIWAIIAVAYSACSSALFVRRWMWSSAAGVMPQPSGFPVFPLMPSIAAAILSWR